MNAKTTSRCRMPLNQGIALAKLSQLLQHARSIPAETLLPREATLTSPDTQAPKLSSIISKRNQSTPKQPRQRRSMRKSKQPSRLTASDFGNVTAAVAFGGEFLNGHDPMAKERQDLKQDWAFFIACGAVVQWLSLPKAMSRK